MKAIALGLLAGLAVPVAHVAPAPVTVIDVLDGDTFVIRGEWAVMNGRKVTLRIPGTVKVRVKGIDTPELPNHSPKCEAEGRAGMAAKAYAQRLLAKGFPKVSEQQFDKYGGRMDAIVTVGNQDYGAAMIAAGFARPYTGEGSKPDWCAILRENER